MAEGATYARTTILDYLFRSKGDTKLRRTLTGLDKLTNSLTRGMAQLDKQLGRLGLRERTFTRLSQSTRQWNEATRRAEQRQSSLATAVTRTTSALRQQLNVAQRLNNLRQRPATGRRGGGPGGMGMGATGLVGGYAMARSFNVQDVLAAERSRGQAAAVDILAGIPLEQARREIGALFTEVRQIARQSRLTAEQSAEAFLFFKRAGFEGRPAVEATRGYARYVDLSGEADQQSLKVFSQTAKRIADSLGATASDLEKGRAIQAFTDRLLMTANRVPLANYRDLLTAFGVAQAQMPANYTQAGERGVQRVLNQLGALLATGRQPTQAGRDLYTMHIRLREPYFLNRLEDFGFNAQHMRRVNEFITQNPLNDLGAIQLIKDIFTEIQGARLRAGRDPDVREFIAAMRQSAPGISQEDMLTRFVDRTFPPLTRDVFGLHRGPFASSTRALASFQQFEQQINAQDTFATSTQIAIDRQKATAVALGTLEGQTVLLTAAFSDLKQSLAETPLAQYGVGGALAGGRGITNLLSGFVTEFPGVTSLAALLLGRGIFRRILGSKGLGGWIAAQPKGSFGGLFRGMFSKGFLGNWASHGLGVALMSKFLSRFTSFPKGAIVTSFKDFWGFLRSRLSVALHALKSAAASAGWVRTIGGLFWTGLKAVFSTVLRRLFAALLVVDIASWITGRDLYAEWFRGVKEFIAAIFNPENWGFKNTLADLMEFLDRTIASGLIPDSWYKPTGAGPVDSPIASVHPNWYAAMSGMPPRMALPGAPSINTGGIHIAQLNITEAENPERTAEQVTLALQEHEQNQAFGLRDHSLRQVEVG